MKKKIFLSAAAAAALLFATGCRQRLPEEELSRAREALSHYLQNCAMTQSEMNILSSFQLKLIQMERYMTEYRIWNQPGYEKIEKAFMADCEAWNKKAQAEADKPGNFVGGSMAPMDRCLRLVAFEEKRIVELKNRWKNK